jgi:hypothetical protein
MSGTSAHYFCRSLLSSQRGQPRRRSAHGERQKLGIAVSQSTAKYMRRHPRPASQTWRTFLTSRASQIMAVIQPRQEAEHLYAFERHWQLVCRYWVSASTTRRLLKTPVNREVRDSGGYVTLGFLRVDRTVGEHRSSDVGGGRRTAASTSRCLGWRCRWRR